MYVSMIWISKLKIAKYNIRILMFFHEIIFQGVFFVIENETFEWPGVLGWLVGQSVIVSLGGKFHFHAPIRALVRTPLAGKCFIYYFFQHDFPDFFFQMFFSCLFLVKRLFEVLLFEPNRLLLFRS